MEKLTLSNGAELENSSVIQSGDLFLYIRGKTMKAVFNLLSVQKNVETIVYTQVNGEDITYTGYKKLIAVRDEDNGLITAVLRRVVENG